MRVAGKEVHIAATKKRKQVLHPPDDLIGISNGTFEIGTIYYVVKNYHHILTDTEGIVLGAHLRPVCGRRCRITLERSDRWPDEGRTRKHHRDSPQAFLGTMRPDMKD